MLALLLALLASSPQAGNAPAPVVVAVDMGRPISGADHLLIAEAARHRALQGADLACYRIHVFDMRGTRRVSFVPARHRTIEEALPDGTRRLIRVPSGPYCPAVSFDMDRDGRVARVTIVSH